MWIECLVQVLENFERSWCWILGVLRVVMGWYLFGPVIYNAVFLRVFVFGWVWRISERILASVLRKRRKRVINVHAHNHHFVFFMLIIYFYRPIDHYHPMGVLDFPCGKLIVLNFCKLSFFSWVAVKVVYRWDITGVHQWFFLRLSPVNIRIRSRWSHLSCLYVRCLDVAALQILGYYSLFRRQISWLLTERAYPGHSCARAPNILNLYRLNPTMRVPLVRVSQHPNIHAYVRSMCFVNYNFFSLDVAHYVLPGFDGLLFMSVSIYILLNLGLSLKLVRHLENLNGNRLYLGMLIWGLLVWPSFILEWEGLG